MSPTNNLKQVRVIAKKTALAIKNDQSENDIGRIYRLEDLKFFVGIQSLKISSSEILTVEAEYISHILSLSLANQAVVQVDMDSAHTTDAIRNTVLFKFLRIQNLKLISSTPEVLIGQYLGKTVLPAIVSKPKKYIIADVVWEILVKIVPLRVAAKYTYRFILKMKERFL